MHFGGFQSYQSWDSVGAHMGEVGAHLGHVDPKLGLSWIMFGQTCAMMTLRCLFDALGSASPHHVSKIEQVRDILRL